jgi:DNA polymerase
VTDFSAIEARVIAWLGGEQWRLDTFRNGGDIYCASASQMFCVPVVKHGVNGHLRQRGKVAELALGYGGGVGAMKTMDTTHTIPEEDMPDIVSKWRERSPRITRLWKLFERCAQTTIETGRRSFAYIEAIGDDGRYHKRTINGKPIAIGFSMDEIDGRRFMLVKLPSGRSIAYPWPALQDGNYGKEIEYWGTDTAHTWAPIRTYGGKLTENIVQATARDCLAEKMIKVEEMGYHVVAHVHDEMIIDVPRADEAAFDRIDGLMAEPIDWAPGLPLKGGTYACDYYQKD